MDFGKVLKTPLSCLSSYKSFLPSSFIFSPFSLSKFDSDPGATTGVGPASQQILDLGWQGPGGWSMPLCHPAGWQISFKVSLVTSKASSSKKLLVTSSDWHEENLQKSPLPSPTREEYFITDSS